MHVGVPKESRPGERRVAAVPATVETMLGWGWTVEVQADAGTEAGFPDDLFVAAGAEIVPDPASAHDADLVLRVGPPALEEVGLTKESAALIGFLDPFVDADLVRALAARNLTSVAVEAIPRTTLAQAMDALSSQANLAGYAAVLMGAQASPKLLPMMVTAAGTIPPSKALILGVGVAGLQAIATARRLGAVVHAYDIRVETKEQVESLGAKFVEAPTAEADEGGYAREVQDDVQQRQFEALSPHVADSDLIVTTAQIPGRPAPLLITPEMVATMHPGSVIVDMAAGTGGNVAGSKPDEVVDIGGVKIFGPTNLASFVPTDASRMYARNLIAFIERVRDKETGEIAFDLDDEIIGGSTITSDGRVVHPRSRQLLGMEDSSA
jgi:NAD(P) transhydrogenase subunit alpha